MSQDKNAEKEARAKLLIQLAKLEESKTNIEKRIMQLDNKLEKIDDRYQSLKKKAVAHDLKLDTAELAKKLEEEYMKLEEKNCNF